MPKSQAWCFALALVDAQHAMMQMVLLANGLGAPRSCNASKLTSVGVWQQHIGHHALVLLQGCAQLRPAIPSSGSLGLVCHLGVPLAGQLDA